MLNYKARQKKTFRSPSRVNYLSRTNVQDDIDEVSNEEIVNNLLLFKQLLMNESFEQLIPMQGFISKILKNHASSFFSKVLNDFHFFQKTIEIFANCMDLNILMIIGKVLVQGSLCLSKDDIIKFYFQVQPNIFQSISNVLPRVTNSSLFTIVCLILGNCFINNEICSNITNFFQIQNFCKMICSIDPSHPELYGYYFPWLRCIYSYCSHPCTKDDSHFILTTLRKIFPSIVYDGKVVNNKCYKYFCWICIKMIDNDTLIKAEFDMFKFIDVCVDQTASNDFKVQYNSLVLVGKYIAKYNENLNLDVVSFLFLGTKAELECIRILGLWISTLILNSVTIEAVLNLDILNMLVQAYHDGGFQLKQEIVLFFVDAILVLSKSSFSEELTVEFLERLISANVIDMMIEAMQVETNDIRGRIGISIATLLRIFTDDEQKRIIASCGDSCDNLSQVLTEMQMSCNGVVLEDVMYLSSLLDSLSDQQNVVL